MNHAITLAMLKARLHENGLAYKVLRSGSMEAVVTQYGGRVFGPFESEDAPGLFWANSAFAGAENFRALIESKDWNIGGDRIWIAPEIPFFVKDRTRFKETYVVQPEIDPGNYLLSGGDGHIALEQNVTAQVFQMRFPKKRVHMQRTLKPILNPLQEMAEVLYFGMEMNSSFTDLSPESRMPIEFWDITQLNPGGEILIPSTTKLEYVDYYAPIGKFIQSHETFSTVKATGTDEFKIALPALQLLGRAAYVSCYDETRYYTIIKQYNNNPSTPYCCEPADRPGMRGCSLFIYNDSGGLGGFTELENSGQTISDGSGIFKSQDQTVYWVYIGPYRQICDIVRRFTGIAYREGTYT